MQVYQWARGSSVGIGTRYGLDGQGIDSWSGDISRTCPDVVLGPTQLPVQWVPCHSPGVKRPGRGVDHRTPPSVEVEERVDLYLYSSLRTFVACARMNVTVKLLFFDR
jgi:hypothetical protein